MMNNMAGGSLFKQVSQRLLTTATMRTIFNNDQIHRSSSSSPGGGRSGLLGLVRLPIVVGVQDISTFTSSAGRSGILGATSKPWERYMQDSSIDLKNCRTFASKAFPKHFRGEMKGICCRGDSISFGTYALKALELAWVTSRQIEAGRRAIARCAHRGGKIWVRVIADKAVSAKPTEVRMGRGKGNPSYRAAVVKPGRILYEIAGVSEFVAKEAIALAASKLPIQTKFVKV